MVALRRRLRRLPTDAPPPDPPPFGMSRLERRLVGLAVGVVGMIVLAGFEEIPRAEPVTGAFVTEIRMAPYRERSLRLFLGLDGRFTFGWRTTYDGTEEDAGEVDGTWVEAKGVVVLTGTWDGSPLAAMHAFRLPGDRHVELAGSGVPSDGPGATAWVVHALRRAAR